MSLYVTEPRAEELLLFKPIRPDFADFRVPVKDSFRWGRILRALDIPIGRFVALYAFRSIKNPGVDEEKLEALDKNALGAAEQAPGFIHYETNSGLSYCLWDSSTQAKAAIGSQEHREAAAYAEEAYERWNLQHWLIGSLTIGDRVEFVEN